MDLRFLCDALNYLIFDYLLLREKLRYKLVCKQFVNMKVRHIDADDLIQNIIDNQTLRQNTYSDLISLNLYGAENITDLTFLKKLKELRIGNTMCSVGDCAIKDLDLEILDICNNKHVTTLDSFHGLKKLTACCNSMINDHGIKSLVNLESLFIKNNETITDLNNSTKLTELDISGTCEVGDRGIIDLENLTNLIIGSNHNITDLNKFTTLTCLDLSNNRKINDNEIMCLSNLRILKASRSLITQFSPFKLLVELDISNCQLIDDQCLQIELPLLKKLNISDNESITDLNQFPGLEELIATWCDIDNQGIKNLVNLKSLNVSNCPNITDLSYLTKLKTLHIDKFQYYPYKNKKTGYLNDRVPRSVEELSATNNKKIYDVSYLTNLRVLYAEERCGIDSKGIPATANPLIIYHYGNPKINPEELKHLQNLILYG